VTVFRRFLRDRRRSTTWWLVGVVATIALTVLFYPTMEGQASFDEMTEQMPEAMRELFGLGGEFSMSSPEGFLQSQLFATMLPILLLVFGIAIGARAIGGSEEDGTLELLLSNPVTRRRVLLERYGTMLALHVLMVVAMAAATFLFGVPVGATDGIPVAWLLGAFAGVLALGLLYGTLAFTVGAVTGKRGKAIAVASAVAIAGYLVEGLGSATDALRPAQVLSPWHWFLSRNMLGQGIAWEALWLPALITALLLAVGLRTFEARDLK